MDEEKKVEEQVEVEESTETKTKKKEKPKPVSKEEYDKLMEQFGKAMQTAAHHQNLSKHYQAEYETLIKYRSQYLMENLLPMIDGFELAFKFEAPTKEAQNYRVGFEFLYKMMLDALQSEGLSVMTPKVGDVFDGTVMQIVEVVPTEDAEQVNKVSEVLLNGYKIKDRLLRPSNVKVYGLKEEKEPVDEKESKN